MNTKLRNLKIHLVSTCKQHYSISFSKLVSSDIITTNRQYLALIYVLNIMTKNDRMSLRGHDVHSERRRDGTDPKSYAAQTID